MIKMELIILGLLCMNMMLLMIIFWRIRIVEGFLKKLNNISGVENNALEGGPAPETMHEQLEATEEKSEPKEREKLQEENMTTLKLHEKEELINEVLSEIFC